MPLALLQHGHAKIDPFLWGLLPDDQMVVDQWAKKFHVSARNGFSLIGAVGEDCAGAVQFVRPERLEVITGAAPPKSNGSTKAISQSACARCVKTIQFSLAGAQPKTALLLENVRWGVPFGRVPTTHILKPRSGEFAGHAEN
jgi:serine/threonine-protein kinase HipA